MMDVTDSTANAAGLSILSLGTVPVSSTTPVTTPPAQFSQQLQALTAAIADPQQLAAGLLEQATFAQNATAEDGSSSAILAQLAELVARLLNDGTASVPDAVPAVVEQVAAATADESADDADSDCCQNDVSETFPVTEIVAAPPTVLSAALLQTLTVFMVDPHKSSIGTPVGDQSAPETVPAAPIGLVQTLSPSPVAALVASPTPTATDDPSDDLSAADASDEQPPAPEIITAATTPFANAAAVVANALPSVATANAAASTPPPAKPTSDASVATNNISAPTIDVKPRETPSPSVIGVTDSLATSTLTDSAEGPTPSEPVSLSPETSSSPSDQRWSAPTSSNSPAPVTDVSQPESRTLPPQDSARLVQRLGQYVVEARDQGRQLSVQITPPDLGPMHIEVGTQNGLLTARLETDSTVAQQLLQEHLPQLHEALQRLGANVERIDVVRTEPLARDRSNGVASGSDWSATSGQSSPDRRDEPRRPNPPPRSAKVSNTSSVAPTTGALQELNIRI